MAVPNIVSTNPTNTQTNVYINQLIYVYFDVDILVSSVNQNTLLMYRSTDYNQIVGTVEYDADQKMATFIPGKVLNTDTAYTFIVVGADQSEDCVKSDTLDSMANSEAIQFVTGTEIYEAPQPTDDEVDVSDDYAPSPTIPVLEPVPDPNFSVTSTYYENGTSNVGTILPSGMCYIPQTGGFALSVTFNQDIYPSGVGHEDWLTITAESVLGDPSVSSGVPSGSVLAPSGNKLYFVAADPSGWYANNEITVNISSDVMNASGNLLGTDQYFAFTTGYDPMYCTIVKTRMAIGPYIKDIPDDTIIRRIHENSIIAYQLANETYGQFQWGIGDPSFAAKMYVCCKTQYDLLNAKLLDRSCSAGQMKRLGDFTIQDPVDISKMLQGPIDSALACMAFWLGRLVGVDARAHPKMVVKGITNPSTPPVRGVRTWVKRYGRYGIPAQNTRLQRRMKLPNIYSQWS